MISPSEAVVPVSGALSANTPNTTQSVITHIMDLLKQYWWVIVILIIVYLYYMSTRPKKMVKKSGSAGNSVAASV